MTKTRAPYAAEFREQMVELVASGRRPQELAREFGCCAQTIHDWINYEDKLASAVLKNRLIDLGQCEGKPPQASELCQPRV